MGVAITPIERKQKLRTILEPLLLVPSIKLAKRLPSLPLVAMMRVFNGIQMSATQLQLAIKTMARIVPCRLLIFGLGNDTRFWSLLNRGGETVFLEDDQFWLERATSRSTGITAHLVNYQTKRQDWKTLLQNPEQLQMTLPDEVSKQPWDMIVVDAPAGYADDTAGRMKSIYMASRLIKNAGELFVHDCNREIETVYCDTFLKSENLCAEIKSSRGDLRHYRIVNQ